MQDCGAIAETLISAGTRVNLGDNQGNLPLHYAARNGNLHLVKALVERGEY